MNRMLLDFSDDELSECSDCSIDGEEWDTESTSTSTDSFYRHDLLGEELFTIWELETYASSEPEDDYSLGSGDDDIASIESLENNMMVLDKHQAIEPHPQQQEGNDQVVVNLPSDLLLKEASPYNNDDGSIDSSASMEERWHVDEHGQAKKSSFQDASWKRDAKRREIQRKMRNLEQRIMVIRSIAATTNSNPPTTTTSTTNKKTERASRPGRRRDTERKGRRRQRPRSLSPERVVDRSASPPRSIVFNDSLENRRRQVALARQKLQERLGRDSSKDVSAATSTTKRTSLTNPRHLHRQKMKRMNPNRIPSRCRTA